MQLRIRAFLQVAGASVIVSAVMDDTIDFDAWAKAQAVQAAAPVKACSCGTHDEVQAASMVPASNEATPTMIPTTSAAPSVPPEVEARLSVLEASNAALSSRIATLESTLAQMCVEDSDSIMAAAGV